jgi:zinc/manganese transport system substrate-binding protein
MRTIATLMLGAAACLLSVIVGPAQGQARARVQAPVQAQRRVLIVAAENFYGDVAHQLAGPGVRVVSILQNPDADPHLFEVDAATARLVADADVLIYNGAHYDPWMQRLLANAGRHMRYTLDVATLLHRQGKDANPHLWYDPQTMPTLAQALVGLLDRLDPADESGHAARLQAFLQSLQPMSARIAQTRRLYGGAPITATEPVADDLAAAAGLSMRNQAFQLAVMNDTEPGPRETAQFEHSLRSHAVRLLMYNRQTSGELVRHMLDIARQAAVPLVAVTETEPAGMSYQAWMLRTLADLDRALATPHP